MYIKNWGAAWALVGLVGITAVGFLFFDTPHCKRNETNCIHNYSKTTKDSNSLYSLSSIGVWARDNKDAIDPLAAIGSVVFAGALVFFTATLWVATRRLAASTAELSAAEAANS